MVALAPQLLYVPHLLFVALHAVASLAPAASSTEFVLFPLALPLATALLVTAFLSEEPSLPWSRPEVRGGTSASALPRTGPRRSAERLAGQVGSRVR